MKSKIPLSIYQTEIMVKVGQNMALARKRRDLSQKELADRSGVSTPTISGMERGTAASTLPTLLKVLTILGLEDSLLSIASPAEDAVGKGLEDLQRKKRVGRSSIKSEKDPFDDNF